MKWRGASETVTGNVILLLTKTIPVFTEGQRCPKDICHQMGSAEHGAEQSLRARRIVPRIVFTKPNQMKQRKRQQERDFVKREKKERKREKERRER